MTATLCGFTILLVLSCEHDAEPDVAIGPAASSDEVQQTLAYRAPGSAQRSAAAVSTTPGRTNYKRARFAAAISGLRFDTGVVEVEPADLYDAEFAWARYDDAVDLIEAGHTLEAIGAYRDSIRWAPDRAEPYNGLGMALRLKNQMTEALAALRTAIQIDPSYVDARFNLAMTLWMIGEALQATRQMQQVVAQLPDHALAHERLAIWNYYAGEAETAWRHVRAARALDHVLPPQFIVLLEMQLPAASR